MNAEYSDLLFMRRCLQLASMGSPAAFPNPLVGAVVVNDGYIIGEGFHRAYGEPHAEVRAIENAEARTKAAYPNARSSNSILQTLYVNLEPCSHYGKTPPCADLIINKGIRRVVVGCVDPNKAVAGKGIERMRAAGIEVTVGILEEECKQLNAPFITYHTQHRPYITLKWAQSSDGFIDRPRPLLPPHESGESPTLFSSRASLMRSHKLRAEREAILIGWRTAIKDNPSLTTRLWLGNSPLRIVLDPNNRWKPQGKLTDNTAPLLHLTYNNGLSRTENIPEQIVKLLYKRGVHSLIVEGGAATLQSFLNAKLYDELRIEHSPLTLGNGVPAPTLPNA